MAAISGRDLIVKKASTAIAAVRTTGISVDNSPVDITSNDDAGFRTLGGFSGVRSMDITLEGVWSDTVVSDLAYGADSGLLLTDVTIEDGQDTISGDFFLASFERSGSHDGEVTYSATLQSSGAWTVTPIA